MCLAIRLSIPSSPAFLFPSLQGWSLNRPGFRRHLFVLTTKEPKSKKAHPAEERAAAAYASALSDGDDTAEQRAEKALKLASEDVTQAAQGKRGDAAVVSALTIEVEKLDEAIAETKQLLMSLHKDLLRATDFLLANRLDKAAQELTNIATQLHFTQKALGWGSSLHGLYASAD
ncbi:hypothetical protein ABE458_15565 [Pseudomonas protegens]|uniref:hypothetical protein n=1 Tax=Pseudomonas protegens TaxID=380021 RepID=UPI00320960A3